MIAHVPLPLPTRAVPVARLACLVTAIVAFIAFLSPAYLHADDHVYLDITMTGSEVNGPKPTPTTELELFSGLGLAFAVGYQRGMWRGDLEWHLHSATAFFHSDTIGVRTLMANGHLDVPLGKHFAFTVGAGVGRASVDVEFVTCLDILGCPTPPFTDTRESALAWQYSLAFAWVYSETSRMTVGFRQLSTSDLGLVDSAGVPFSDDQLDMPLAILGWQHRFRH